MEVIFNLDEIEAAAEKIITATPGHNIIALHGNMGAGKTTFIHALCTYWGVADTVSSPTFSIINQYKTRDAATIYHIDLYRLKDEHEAINSGVEDCLYSGSTCLVEWPEIAPGIFPPETIHLYLTAVNGHTRKIVLVLKSPVS